MFKGLYLGVDRRLFGGGPAQTVTHLAIFAPDFAKATDRLQSIGGRPARGGALFSPPSKGVVKDEQTSTGKKGGDSALNSTPPAGAMFKGFEGGAHRCHLFTCRPAQ